MSTLRRHTVTAAAFALLAACGGITPARRQIPNAPYAPSSQLAGLTWDLGDLGTLRRAHGSDIWPCAWAVDDFLYCGWGDGGGFDGDSDTIGRVSLGFARISGRPDALGGWRDVKAKNIWGAPPFAEVPATFGGKAGSMLEAGEVLFAAGKFWLPSDTPDPVHKGGPGPHDTLAWSVDRARHWTVASWSIAGGVGSFLDRGRPPTTGDEYVYLYYFRDSDDGHLFLRRAHASALRNVSKAPHFEFYSGPAWLPGFMRWSKREARAAAVFADANHVEGPCIVYDQGLRRYLLTAGHYFGGDDGASSAGRWGMFESRFPWGPWSTVAYYDNWANLDPHTKGDYLGFRVPSRWISADGRDLWGVFSGLQEFDSFNLVHGTISIGQN